MQTTPYHGGPSHLASSKHRRSGYEPSDTETDFQESPWRDHSVTAPPEPRAQLGLDSNGSRRFHSSRFDHPGGGSSPPAKSSSEASARRRHTSKSPYKPKRDTGGAGAVESKRERVPLANKRSATAPRSRPKVPVSAGITSGEINEMAASRVVRLDGGRPAVFESMGSISPGDIFFSREWTALALPKKKPNSPPSRPPAAAAATGFSSSGSGRFSTGSAGTTDSARRFTANRRKSAQKETTWFGCVKKTGTTCSRRSSKSPEKTTFDEALFIEKAFVVEKLRPFWADKYRPSSFDSFTRHKQQAQLLKQLVSSDVCPHILLVGPSGSGKRSLATALLREIFGDGRSNVTYDLRYFQVQENRPMQVVVPIASSAHHLEINVHSEPNAKFALMGLIREIIKVHTVTPEIVPASLPPNYKVMVLYDVDKVTDKNIQHLIKWIMDCYTDACKLVLCCEDDSEIIESVTNRCKVIKIDAPITHEIMEVLIQISRKEDFDLPMGFAAKIAIKSKHNLRKAIMALESCKAHNYPFVEDQPIPIGWEEILVEISTEILANPAPDTLFLVRGRFQKLLAEFVHPKLILQKLVEQFLKGIDASIKREIYYWHAYYDKRLPIGPSALLKLEEFVAKSMSIYRRSSSNRQFT